MDSILNRGAESLASGPVPWLQKQSHGVLGTVHDAETGLEAVTSTTWLASPAGLGGPVDLEIGVTIPYVVRVTASTKMRHPVRLSGTVKLILAVRHHPA